VGRLALEAPPFVAIGSVVGLAVPWLYLGHAAEKRQRLIAGQVAQLLVLVAGAAAAAIPLPRILREVLPKLKRLYPSSLE
jgi:Flp pilus assembly protein TadB